MKLIIPVCLALAWLGFMASALLTAPAPAPSAPRANLQMSSVNYMLDWSAVGEISGGNSASANYNLNATIVQMAANTSSASANGTASSCATSISRAEPVAHVLARHRALMQCVDKKKRLGIAPLSCFISEHRFKKNQIPKFL